MISEQSLEGWDNNPVKFSNVKYPQTKDDNAPKNFFLAIFCGSRGSGKTYLLTKLLKLLEEKKMYYEGIEIPQRIILICSTAHSDSNRVFKSLKNLNWDDDVIEDYNDSLLQDKMEELKSDALTLGILSNCTKSNSFLSLLLQVLNLSILESVNS